MTTEEETTGTGGFDFLTTYTDFATNFVKANMKGLITSSLVWSLSKLNPYKKRRADKYIAGFRLSADVHEGINSLLSTYSDVINDLIMSPIFLNLKLENKALVSGLKGVVARMSNEILFSEDPDYSIAVVYFASHYAGDMLTEIISKKLEEGMTPTEPPIE